LAFIYFKNILVVLVGLASLGLGVYQFWSSLNFHRRAIRVEGKVTGLRRSDRSITYPTVSFTTTEGKKVVFSSESGSNIGPKIGDSVNVYYQPDDPKKAKVASFVLFWLPALLFVVVGAFFLFYAYIKFLAH